MRRLVPVEIGKTVWTVVWCGCDMCVCVFDVWSRLGVEVMSVRCETMEMMNAGKA